jgi:hypothetical protein
MERFAQRQSALLLAHTDERVSLQLSWEAMEHAADFPGQHLRVHIATTSVPPVLRSLHFSRTSGGAGQAAGSGAQLHRDFWEFALALDTSRATAVLASAQKRQGRAGDVRHAVSL